MLHCIGGIGGVDSGDDASCVNGAHGRVEPFGAIEGQHTHRMVLLQTELNERLGHLVHLLLILSADDGRQNNSVSG